MARLLKDNAAGKLANGVSATDNTLVLQTGQGVRFPSPTGGDVFPLTLIGVTAGEETAWEIVHVTARIGDTLTVVRGQEGTTAAIWAADTKAELRLTASEIAAKQDALVSATNIKTVNGESLLGSGNLSIASGGGGSITAIASGAIDSAGLVVALNSDGTVSAVSGNDTAIGAPAVFGSASSVYLACCYDSVTQKIVIAYSNYSNGLAVVGTVSGTSISFGSPVVFESAQVTSVSCCYDATAGKVVIAYSDQGNSGYGTAVVGTVSGNAIEFGLPVVFLSAHAGNPVCCYDATSGKVVIAYSDSGNSNYGTAVVLTSEKSNKNSRIGIAKNISSNGESVAITTIGGTASSYGLTPNAVYYVGGNGGLTTIAHNNPRIGRALSSDKLLITDVV